MVVCATENQGRGRPLAVCAAADAVGTSQDCGQALPLALALLADA